MEPDERIDILKDWMSRDRDIKMIVHAALRATGADTVEVFNAAHPVEFDQVYESVSTMIDDIPIHEPPGWAR